ncbi:MAG: hemerythrin domain-containing protein [Gammaproteobacteria bacterium]|nr:hemerythrin domain-containing protein [Gammaproteobacteria bacterium]
MNDPLKKFRAEHVDFRRLLGIVEEEVQTLAMAGRPDYAILLDAMDYMTQYPDRFHHPVEDFVFAHLAQQQPQVRAAVDELHAEHRAIAASGTALRQRLEAVVNGALMPRAALLEPASEYVRVFHAHMEREERLLLPLAERALDAGDLAQIELPAPDHEDPLFGSREQHRYQALQRRLAARIGCGCAVGGA